MKLSLKNSIYSKGYTMGSGLDVENGRLINNRPDGMTGIAQCAANKKIEKRMNKIEMYSDAVALGNLKSEMQNGLKDL